MNEYCPDCGRRLQVIQKIKKYWIELLACEQCETATFLLKYDAKFGDILQRIGPHAMGAARTADETLLEEAAALIKLFDCKTISVIDFERRLLNMPLYRKPRKKKE